MTGCLLALLAEHWASIAVSVAFGDQGRQMALSWVSDTNLSWFHSSFPLDMQTLQHFKLCVLFSDHYDTICMCECVRKWLALQ